MISIPQTRCPFQITTTATERGQSWSCKISLSRRYELMRSGKWSPIQPNSVSFTEVTDRADLERVLQLAQTAILNPHIDPATLLYTGGANTTALSFSPNVIELYISGPELPELSFIDLPGSINVAPNANEQHLVLMIERLVKSFVRDDQALILLVASMNQDLETSTAFRLVGNCKASARSMGVLTKPDLLERSAARITDVRRTLNGGTFKLGNLWFVTKNSSQDQLEEGVTHLEARKSEETFFQRVPWSSDLAEFKGRFGTRNLQNAISHRLVAHIERELPGGSRATNLRPSTFANLHPEIIQRVNARLKEVCQELDDMPERPIFPSQTVIEEAHKVARTVAQYTQGNDDEASFRTKYKETLRKFCAQLQAARPQIVLGTPGYVRPVLSVDSDDEDAPSPSKRQRISGDRSTPSSSTSNGMPTSNATSTSNATPRTSRVVKQDSSVSEGKAVFNLQQVHVALDKASNSDLPDQVHPKVIERFIHQATAYWPSLTSNILENIGTLVSDMLATCISDALRARKKTKLLEQVSQIVDTFCQQVFDNENKFIQHVVECEVHKPITYAGILKQTMPEVRGKLKDARLKERIDEYYDTISASAEKQVKVPTGEKRKERAKDLDFVTKALGPDRYANEVSAMASPLAYYDLASGRLLDTVANHLERGVLYRIETELQNELIRELRVTDSAYCAELLAEDPEREAQRLQLIAEKAKLEEAIEQLQNVNGRY